MAITISVGGSSNQITAGNISYSRDGVYSYVFVYGNKNKIETTVAEVSASLSSNVSLEENWDTTVAWNASSAETDGTKYQDHYRRFSVAPDDTSLDEIDVLATVSGSPKTPRGYRDMQTTLIRKLTPTPADTTEFSAYSTVKDGSWTRTADVGILVNTDANGNAPAILFNAKVEVKDETKDLPKAASITMVSLGRVYSDNFVVGSNIETDFIPFLVTKKDRFRAEYIRKSFRDNPSGTAIDGLGVNDGSVVSPATKSNIQQYAENQNDTFGRLQMGGGVTLIGNAAVNVGDTVSNLNIYYEGAYVSKSVEFLVVSRVYDFTTDTTAIDFGRP